MPRVVIIQKSLPAYRKAFFDALRRNLETQGVELHLIYGRATGREATKSDETTIRWGHAIQNRSLKVGKRHFIWQPIPRETWGADLIIVEQANKLLVNYLALARQYAPRGPRVGFWGHGANLQAKGRMAKWEEVWKRGYSKLPHWWFAYTQGSAERAMNLGIPPGRVTVVQNAIASDALRTTIKTISKAELDMFCTEYRLKRGMTCIYIGSLYKEKRLPFLIETASAAHAKNSDFSLLIAGDGPDREFVEAAAASTSFIHYLGRLDGPRKALALRASELMLMPGLVGLAIIDAFAAEVPIVTTAIDYHSPEIEYLEPEANGQIYSDPDDVDGLATFILSTLQDDERMASLRSGCRLASSTYTLEAMVSRYAAGIVEALATERPKRFLGSGRGN